MEDIESSVDGAEQIASQQWSRYMFWAAGPDQQSKPPASQYLVRPSRYTHMAEDQEGMDYLFSMVARASSWTTSSKFKRLIVL